MASASSPPKTPPHVSLSSSDSSSDSDSETQPPPFESSIFTAYLQTSSSSSPDLSKIKTFLLSSRAGASACLICLARIRPSDPVWSCSSSCHALFHLLCIQTWARQPSHLPAHRASFASASSTWHCPKCRFDYSNTLIPRQYLCFCGKLENPPCDPWILPHSCGELCGRPLKPDCGHGCLLLCHPGPCPPCPKLVTQRCFCGSVDDVRRCAFKRFSCSGDCAKLLACGVHRCKEKCHYGQCPPCGERGVYYCLCGKREEERECFRCVFQCGCECGGMLDCGKHGCDRGCHLGPCGTCPFQGKRLCPCGKKLHEGMACDAIVPTCGSTCEKILSCGRHRCPERCHRGPCVETCRIVVFKSCRCGSLKKEVPCYQDLSCERKCQRVRDCGRHPCKRRCCDGDCPPCSEICGRKLRCNNHKCPSPCHRGTCAPCPLMVSISCSCGETRFEVPCGIEAQQKPPKCSKPCSIYPLCRHGFECKPHKCHYGACPPCQLICGEEFPCGHKCKRRCHGPRPPPNPEFTLKPKKKKLNQQAQCTSGSPCPPCQEVVSRSCLGQHIGAERLMVCSDKATFSCHNLCGNPLQCGNHYCEKPCHVLKSLSLTLDLHDINENFRKHVIPDVNSSESCEECFLPCQKERKPPCPHPCPLPCHAGNCSPCKLLIKRSCHCGSMVHVFECSYFNNLLKEEQKSIRSCGGPCHRKLLNCTHLCPVTCHPGECPLPDKCCKKVTIRCACLNSKKEWLCQDVQAAYRSTNRDPRDISKNQFGIGLLPCNSDCMSKLKVVDSELQFRKTKVTEAKEVDTGYVPKRRKRRERVQEEKKISCLQAIGAAIWKCLLFIFIVAALFAAAYYGYKGLLRLSDWMNEVEERRMRKRFPSI